MDEPSCQVVIYRKSIFLFPFPVDCCKDSFLQSALEDCLPLTKDPFGIEVQLDTSLAQPSTLNKKKTRVIQISLNGLFKSVGDYSQEYDYLFSNNVCEVFTNYAAEIFRLSQKFMYRYLNSIAKCNVYLYYCLFPLYFY